MSRNSAEGLPFPINDALIEEAAARLDISGGLAGQNGLLLLDVTAPTGSLDPALVFVADAAVGLHREIQDDDELSDLEEALEDPLRGADQHGIDEACDRYRALLASRLKTILRLPDGDDRIMALRAIGRAPFGV